MNIIERIRSKKDVRLYFKFLANKKVDMTLGKLKTELIKLNYISHVEGDRYIELKKINVSQVLRELADV